MTVKEVFEAIGLGLPEGCDRIYWGKPWPWEENDYQFITKAERQEYLLDEEMLTPLHWVKCQHYAEQIDEDVTDWPATACYLVLPQKAQELLRDEVFGGAE